MTELLVKLFVKDYLNTEDGEVRTRYGLMSSIVGICCNLLLFAVKIMIGIAVKSISVTADAFNNLSDAASSIIGFVGVKMAQKPADEDHPFGHGRIEYIAAFIVAFLVLQVGFSLFKTSLGKIREPEAMTFHFISVVLLFLSVGIKLWMGFFNKKLGKRINSKVMLATSADSLGDVAATSATILSMIVFGLTDKNIDGIVGLIVSLVVMFAGYNIAKDTLAPLIGEAIDPAVYQEINDFVKQYDGIVGTHDLIIHNYGPSRSMASIHAEVPNDINVEKSHEVIDRIEQDAMKKLHMMLVIHMDPVEMKNEIFLKYRDIVNKVLKDIDSKISMHDFRLVDGENRINLIFDLVVPIEYKKEVRDNIRMRINQEVHKADSRCFCVINMESSYCAEKTEG